MSRKISCTITVGASSEIHNHDLDYRATLKHVHGMAEDVIELIPYISYKEQINELMKPYITEYNAKQQARYKSAWDRYNAGIIKNKPRKANYKPMGYDYFEDHKDDVYYNRAKKQTEPIKMWRGLIFGLGDKEDRDSGLISQKEAIAVMSGVVERWPEIFPDFVLLGATIHLDEDGFYHCHIDYKPLCKTDKELKQEQGLQVTTGQEAALEHMGYEPEQSIINESDKVPIRFNAFRNKLYYEVESELNKHNIRLWYGASKEKEPTKDSSINQPLNNWQDTKDEANKLQMLKNNMLDIIENDKVSPDGYKQAVSAATEVMHFLDRIKSQRRSRTNKENVVIHFSLFDQLKSLIQNFVDVVAHLFQTIKMLKNKLNEEQEQNEFLNAEIDRLKPLEIYDSLEHKLEVSTLKSKIIEQNEFMKKYKIGNKSLYEIYLNENPNPKTLDK